MYKVVLTITVIALIRTLKFKGSVDLDKIYSKLSLIID